jgi:hypothetical protein
MFVYAMLFFKLPDIDDGNILQHKFIIFLSLFCFYFLVQIIGKIKNKCKIDINDITTKSLTVAVSGVMGYTLYQDLGMMEWSRNYINNFNITSRYNRCLYITVIITLFISVVRILQVLFNNDIPECVNYE